MIRFLQGLFLADFMPHRLCLRLPELIWLDALSDGMVALSYFLILFALMRLTKRREDLVFPWLFLLFAIFILSCGTTHLLAIVALWTPVYRFEGVIKALTAVASLPTAVLLIRLVPRIAALPGPQQWFLAKRTLEGKIEQHTSELRETNAKLTELTAAWELSYGRLRNLDGVITFWCKGSEQFYGWTAQQAIGRISHELLQTRFPRPLREIQAELPEKEPSRIHNAWRKW